MAATPPEPPAPSPSARVIIPDSMVYHGELPSSPPERIDTAPESVWRNVALTLATVLVIVIGGAVIFWPSPDDLASTDTGQAVSASASAAGGPGSTAAARVAMPTGDLPGWRQTFAEDFTGGNLANRWYIYEGQPGSDPGGYFLRSHVKQRDSKLVIEGSKESTPNGDIYATGGISNSKVFSQTYGRFELRFRMDRGVGIAYALMLWPSDDVWPPELDIAEDNGDQRQAMWTFVHSKRAGKQGKQIRGDFSVWHTVRVDWSPGSLVYTLDGTKWATITGAVVPDNPMSIALQTQAWPCGMSWAKCPNSTTPAVVNLEVDWVVAYTAT